MLLSSPSTVDLTPETVVRTLFNGLGAVALLAMAGAATAEPTEIRAVASENFILTAILMKGS